jgi:hypothetical protein
MIRQSAKSKSVHHAPQAFGDCRQDESRSGGQPVSGFQSSTGWWEAFCRSRELAWIELESRNDPNTVYDT